MKKSKIAAVCLAIGISLSLMACSPPSIGNSTSTAGGSDDGGGGGGVTLVSQVKGTAR